MVLIRSIVIETPLFISDLGLFVTFRLGEQTPFHFLNSDKPEIKQGFNSHPGLYGHNLPTFLSLITSFLSIKLTGEIDNCWCLEQMMCHINSHGMEGVIHGRIITSKENGDSKSKEEDTPVEWKISTL